MTRIRRLKHEAREAAHFRGHSMGKFETLSRTSARSLCQYCLRGVWVDTSPLPNGIDIAGEAVAVGCYPRHIDM
jgi:hypothetical protein